MSFTTVEIVYPGPITSVETTLPSQITTVEVAQVSIPTIEVTYAAPFTAVETQVPNEIVSIDVGLVGGGATPAGPEGALQFNENSELAGSEALTWDSALTELRVGTTSVRGFNDRALSIRTSGAAETEGTFTKAGDVVIGTGAGLDNLGTTGLLQLSSTGFQVISGSNAIGTVSLTLNAQNGSATLRTDRLIIREALNPFNAGSAGNGGDVLTSGGPNGKVSWKPANGFAPHFVPLEDEVTVPAYAQAFWRFPITVNGVLNVQGYLVNI